MGSNIINTLLYTKDHEWADFRSNGVLVGISDFAQLQLGEIIYLELPEVGKLLKKGEPFGAIESIKSVNDLISPISGEIIKINSSLESKLELCNTAPYESWMVEIKPSNLQEKDLLMTASEYKTFIQK